MLVTLILCICILSFAFIAWFFAGVSLGCLAEDKFGGAAFGSFLYAVCIALIMASTAVLATGH